MASLKTFYDAVILGAGLGGLTVGGILARRGRQVLVLEEASEPGGFSSVRYGDGFPFLNTPVFLLGLEKNGYGDQVFSELGISLALLKRQNHLLRRPAPFLQVVTEDYRISLETDRAEQFSEYKREWGESLAAFQRLRKDLEAADPSLYPALGQRPLPGTSLPLKDRLRAFRLSLKRRLTVKRLSRMTGLEGLSRHGLPSAFLQMSDFLALLCFGSGLERASCLDVYRLQLLCSREVLRPVGGLSRLCEPLAKVVRENRGTIHCRQRVKDFGKKDRKEWLVHTDDGQRIRARHLVIHYPQERLRPPAYGSLCFFFTVDPQAIPTLMGELVLVGRRAESSAGPDYLLLLALSQPEEEKNLIEPRRLLTVRVLKPVLSDDEAERRDWLHEVLKCLHWLMPFSKGKLQYRGSNAEDLRARAGRFAAAAPLLHRMRRVERLEAGEAYWRLGRRLFFLPDASAFPAMTAAEVRLGDEIGARILGGPRSA